MKKAWAKINQNGAYESMAPNTYADQVYSYDNGTAGTVRTELNDVASTANTALNNSAKAAKLVVQSNEPQPDGNTIWVKP